MARADRERTGVLSDEGERAGGALEEISRDVEIVVLDGGARLERQRGSVIDEVVAGGADGGESGIRLSRLAHGTDYLPVARTRGLLAESEEIFKHGD